MGSFKAKLKETIESVMKKQNISRKTEGTCILKNLEWTVRPQSKRKTSKNHRRELGRWIDEVAQPI